MRTRFFDIAQRELDEAIEYYNYESQGLGNSFLMETLNATDRLEKFPEAWPRYSERTRKCPVHGFPYGIIYMIRSEEIFVVAIANMHRKPA
jgi:hypothetical protein